VTNGLPNVVRIGVVGDVHVEDERLERGLSVLKKLGVDAILCVGDVVDGPGDLERCVAALEAETAYVIKGNHERWLLAGEMRSLPHATPSVSGPLRATISAWPTTLDFATPLGNLRLAHGVDDDDMAELRTDTRGYALQAIPRLRELMLDPEVTFHLGGHTHERMARAFPGLVTLNAGTLSGDDPTVMHIDFAEKKIVHISVATSDPKPVAELALPDPLPIPRV